MANKILAGDEPFTKGMGVGVGVLGVSAAWECLEGKIASVDVVTEENKSRVMSKLGWGSAGMMLFGPAGALAGLMLGGNRKEICFACQLKDGRKFLAVADAEIYQKFAAAAIASNLTSSMMPNPHQEKLDEFSKLPKWEQNATCLVYVGLLVFFVWLISRL